MPRNDNITADEISAPAYALSKQHRAVLTSFNTHGTYEKIAADLNVPVGTVKSSLNRARKAVQKMRAASSPPTLPASNEMNDAVATGNMMDAAGAGVCA